MQLQSGVNTIKLMMPHSLANASFDLDYLQIDTMHTPSMAEDLGASSMFYAYCECEAGHEPPTEEEARRVGCLPCARGQYMQPCGDSSCGYVCDEEGACEGGDGYLCVAAEGADGVRPDGGWNASGANDTSNESDTNLTANGTEGEGLEYLQNGDFEKSVLRTSFVSIFEGLVSSIGKFVLGEGHNYLSLII